MKLNYIQFLIYFLLLQSSALLAKDYPWLEISNPYFVAYTNAKESEALTLLGELERFRVATTMALQVKIPTDAPRTRIIIFRNANEFRKYEIKKNIVGYVITFDPGSLVVMPASIRGLEEGSIIRHEYVHVILGYHTIRFPRWYNEGLAEFVSGIRMEDDKFIIGVPPMERFERRLELLSYDKIIKDDYDPHKIRLNRGDAYAQYWLLTSYLLLGNPERTKQLNNSLLYWQEGMSAIEAFKHAFGKLPSKMWKSELKPYLRNPSVMTIEFDSEAATSFTINAADINVVREYLDRLAEAVNSYKQS